MLKSPKLGMKKQTMEVILLREEKSPQSRMKNVELKGTNCFSVFTVLRRRVMQLFRVMAIEIPRAAIGVIGIPKMLFCCLNTACKPPVVLVFVVANKSRMSCPAT